MTDKEQIGLKDIFIHAEKILNRYSQTLIYSVKNYLQCLINEDFQDRVIRILNTLSQQPKYVVQYQTLSKFSK